MTFSLSSFSSLLPPLAAIGDIVTVKEVNASIVNFDGISVKDLVSSIRRAEENTGKEFPQPHFMNLPLKSDNKIGKECVKNGTSLYAVLEFGKDSILFANFASIQEGEKLPGNITLYAQVAKDSTESLFLAYVPTLTLIGLLSFTDIKFQYTPSNEGVLSLTGDISIPALGALSKLHGSLQIRENVADFSLTGSKQPQKLSEPLGMFGVSISNPELLLQYNFKPFSSTYKLSGSVTFHPITTDRFPATKTSITLTAMCIFKNGIPKVVDIALLTLKHPLTVADLVSTIFNTCWDKSFLNVGFYNGRLYYADLEDGDTVKNSTDDFEYKSGYHMTCQTFLFSKQFQFNIDMSLNKTGFAVTGSTLHPLDFKLFQSFNRRN